jgi:flavin-dependent dehydrogenase
MLTGSFDPDVVIVGAGPAGALAAVVLSPTHRVTVVEARASPRSRIGESLPPAAGRLLDDLGLLESFKLGGHVPCFANRFVWGESDPAEHDFLRDPSGHGWHIDRAGFETWLRQEAVKKGAALMTPARVATIEADGDGWRVTLADGRVLRCSFLIDAGGRAAPLARKLGARICRQDRLVCRWIRGRAGPAGTGLSYVEAAKDGWWYTAPVPGGRRILAFHTDADLPAARRRGLIAAAEKSPGLAEMLAAARFVPEGRAVLTAAHSAVLEPFIGRSWLAAGDAALSFDPLSSQGIMNALFTGRAAAQAAANHLAGSRGALGDYASLLAAIHADYRRQLRLWYGTESRWPGSQFWRRRQGA